MPLRKMGDVVSPLGDRDDSRGASAALLLLRLSVLFMKVRAKLLLEPREPLRSVPAGSLFELVLVALARRKKLKLGRRADWSDGEAGLLSGLMLATAIGGMARLSAP